MCNIYTKIYGVEMDMETMGCILRTQCVTHIHVRSGVRGWSLAVRDSQYLCCVHFRNR